MSNRAVLRSLKNISLSRTNVSLAIISEYKKNFISHYTIKYVQIDAPLEKKLRKIVTDKIAISNIVEEYTFESLDPEGGMVKSIESNETDFSVIIERLNELNEEEDTIESIDDLYKAKAYVIILRNRDGIKVVAFKTLPENWKMKKNNGLIPLLFRENRFEDLEDEKVFSISNAIDFIYFEELLFILSKKGFEKGLNFREGMISKANEMYEEVESLNLFVNMELLKERVGNNQRYLRKIATIKNLGHYRNPDFLAKVQTVFATKGWQIKIENNQIVFTEDTLDVILSVLQNKRLHSEFTNEDFDVEGVKALT